jgi:hypothetical protein
VPTEDKLEALHLEVLVPKVMQEETLALQTRVEAEVEALVEAEGTILGLMVEVEE